jgi:subtilisin family serine protease
MIGMRGTLRSVRPRSLLAAASLLALSIPATPVHAATTGALETYIVLYRDGASSNNAAGVIQGAGGQLVYSYPQIGVVIATSNRSDFAANMRSVAGVEGASATTRFATRLKDDVGDAAAAPTVAQGIPAGGDSQSGLQWDMLQINAFDAHAIESGSRAVTVGDIDTGLDYTHPDLAANVDFANSVSCINNGVPDQSPAAWNDQNGHGTHTAGTIAAAKNGIGIVGVAPNVKVAGIRAGNADGFFFPAAVVCAFVWAGTHHAIKVTNNSYFADPWLFNCKNDLEQRAIWKAESRAIRFAMQQGVTVVAAAGNEADDLAHPTQDITSPDDTTPMTRTVHNDCAVIPVEVPGVIGVSADGNSEMKSFYSSYGVGAVQVTAPGGDSILQTNPPSNPLGRVLSTWPSALINNCVPARRVFEGSTLYCYQQGTSMASPHVAGVAALIASLGVTQPGAVQARINNTADPLPCPADVSIYAFFHSVDNGAPQQCQGGAGYNSWYGHGQVNALAAVS